ncbi:MAG: transglutaminase family protein [Pseudomonadales bacterium]|nr:transglutaminase family protein [Pseudomonadales bacterium]
MTIDSALLEPTFFLDFEHPTVQRYADDAAGEATDPVEIAQRLFLKVRDGIRYNPYSLAVESEAYKASHIAESESNWCIPKSVLLTACARYKGIPARLGFADVKNHLTSEKLSESMGTDLFAWHGYSELRLHERWIKLSTAFNIGLCEKFGTRVLEFDGEHDALMHPYDQAGRRHMEYVRQRGSYNDLPLTEIFDTFLEVYPNWVKHEDGSFSKQGSGGQNDEAFGQ